MKKSVFFSLLAIILALGFIGCDFENEKEQGLENQEFTVSFDLDGGNINGNTVSVEIKVNSGETVDSLPLGLQKTDFVFNGWFTDKKGLGSPFTSETKITSNRTVYAKWLSIDGGNGNNPNGGNSDDPFSGTWINEQVGMRFEAENGTWKQYLASFSQDGKSYFYVETIQGTYTVSEDTITKTITKVNMRRFGGQPDTDLWVDYANLDNKIKAYLPKNYQFTLYDNIIFVFDVILNGGAIVKNTVFIAEWWLYRPGDSFSGIWTNLETGMTFEAENGTWKQYLLSEPDYEIMQGTYTVTGNIVTKTITNVNMGLFGGQNSLVEYANLNSNIKAHLSQTSQTVIFYNHSFNHNVISYDFTFVNMIFLKTKE